MKVFAAASLICAGLAQGQIQRPVAGAVTQKPVRPPRATPQPTPTDRETGDGFCTQTEFPPGVKPGGCLQLMCAPKAVSPGDTFHTTVRWCMQRPRQGNVVFSLLDVNTKEYFTGDGYPILTDTQCGEHTFEAEFNAKPSPGTGKYDLMWKFYIIPEWGNATYTEQDSFPNMLAETGIALQPAYGQKLIDCPDRPTRTFTPKDFKPIDAIQYSVLPSCITPGQPWSAVVDTNLVSRPVADFRANLQLGTGGDLYLGPEDVFVAESNIFNITANPPNQEWVPYMHNFTAADTRKIKEGDRPYISSFLVPAGSQYDPKLLGGWDYLDREFFLELEICPKEDVAAELKGAN